MPRLMGWGDPAQSARQRLRTEEVSYEVFAARSEKYIGFGTYMDTYGYRKGRIWERVKSHFEFDEGFAFWVPEQIVYGSDLEPGPQDCGDCVGYSHTLLLASKIAVEILLLGQPEEPLGLGEQCIPYVPYSYGVGRCNRDGVLGRSRLGGDGSNCSWQVEATMEHGFLPSNVPGLPGPYPEPSASVTRQWGSSPSILNRYRPQAIEFDLLDSARITNGDDALRAMTEALTPLQICSGWGFRYAGWDDKYRIGVYRKSGSWAHSMQVVAAMRIKGQWFCVIRNQWGRRAHHDCGRGIPKGSFAVPWELFSDWIKQAYVATIGEIKGLPSYIPFPG